MASKQRPKSMPAADDLWQVEQRMRSVVDHIVDGIVSIDEHGTITTFNRAAERIFGYAASEVIGLNVKLLMPDPYRSEHDRYVENYLRTGQAKIIGVGREVVGRRKDGSVFPMELAISEFTFGERRHFTGIVRDITERKRAEQARREAEERMRSVVDHVVDGIITIDVHARIASFNPAAEVIFGYLGDEVIGRNVNVLMPEPYHGEHDGYVRNYLSTGRARIIGIGREVVGRRKDGTTFPMELAVSEFHIGQQRYFTGIVRDITERKRLESELRERLAELATADRQKNEFLAMLAHELRNPLAPLRNALQILKTIDAGPPTAHRARDIMDRQLHHLVRLVDDLLDVSRIVRGRVELRREVIDVADAVARAVETAQPLLDANGHMLDSRLPEAPVWVDADVIRLAQVIGNLLTNAAKYTVRPGRIMVTARREGDDAVIRVRDPGIGIAADVLPHIFDLFVQGKQTLARSAGGLGIGLTLVRRLVEMHGGHVSAFSAGPGEGSEFVVTLPAVPAPIDASPNGSDQRHEYRHPAVGKVLVVDDNIDACESIALILEMAGYDARCVNDGPSVLREALEYRPDAIVLDIGLPGMSGYEVAAQLRQHPAFSDTPLVAATGYGQERDRRQAKQAGFDAHLVKPIDAHALRAFLDEVIRRTR